MARLDAYPMPGREAQGYILDVQSTLLAHLKTRTVVPLLPEAEAPPRINDLNPVFTINGQPYVMVTQALATIPIKELRGAAVSLDRHHDEVIRALDILFIGY